MTTRRPDGYGEAFADVYDTWYEGVTDAEATARFVASRCHGGPVLELGVGTGRLAGPLVRHGMTVVGLDASAAMLRRCAAERPHPRLQLVQGDMAALPLTGCFGAVLIAYNTLFNLPTGRSQGGLFQQLGSLVAADGVVIIEALDPQLLAAAAGRSIGVSAPGTSDDRVTVVTTDVDPARQTIVGRHLEIHDGGVAVRPWYLRWSTPEEIDQFASRAGFELAERFASWDGAGYDERSETRISVYRRFP